MPALPTVAVITMGRDEKAMLPRWIDHYSRQVGVENLIVFDDNSTDGSTDSLPCTVHRIPPFSGDTYVNSWMRLMSGVGEGLLAVYDWVIFVDVDEFLIPDPARYQTLPEFLAARPDREIIGSLALNVMHHTGVEKAIDPSQPVLGQRRFAKFAGLMCKPSTKRVPAAWRMGSHGIMAPFEVDPELFMIHLKFYDRETLVAVSEHRRALVAADGRADKSSWTRSGDEMAALLDQHVAPVDPDTVPEFDPASVDLSSLVHQTEKGMWRTPKRGQVVVLEQDPLVRVPDRLLGLV